MGELATPGHPRRTEEDPMDRRFGDAAVVPTPPTPRPVFASRTPFDENRVGAAAVYCSDGRYGEQMDEFLHEGLGVPHYDRVAVPGGAACLAGHSNCVYEKESLERQLKFLIETHDLNRLIFIAHQDCGFYRDVWLGS